jgi:hypothetical protein
VDYFEEIGFKCDKDTNPSDFFMYIMQSKNEGLSDYLNEHYEDFGGPRITSKINKTLSSIRDEAKILKNFPDKKLQFRQLFNRSVNNLLRNPV